jgi:uncharacterized membrane protein
METNSRSIVKAVSYRILGSLSTGLIFFVLTGKFSLSVGAGMADFVIKIVLYFLHERLWNHISYGRDNKAPEYEI